MYDFAMITTRFTRLVGCTVPIQVAPMGAVSSPELIGAAIGAGAHAVVGATGLPPEAVEARIDAAEASAGRRVAVNFLVPFLTEELLAIAARRAAMVDFYHAAPERRLVDVAHSQGAQCAWQVTSLDEALAARECGCDLLIVHGRESGGRNPKGIGLLPLLQQVLDTVVDVPVLAAGGIATARGVAAALASGADGVRIGTRFVASAESGAHPAYVRALLAAYGEDTVLTDVFSAGWPDGPAAARVIGHCIERAEALDSDIVGHLSIGAREVPIPRFSPPPPVASMTGAIEAMPFYAGEAVGLVRRVEPARAIIEELSSGAERLLRSASSLID
jgi:nitronate monooxygenase